MMMKECCKTCRKRLDLEKWDYTDVANNGVPKTKYDGFVCFAFASEGLAMHSVGGNEEEDMCKMYSEKG